MTQHLPGVYVATRKDNSVYYRASLTFRRKHISIGSFDTMQKAHFAYQEALSLVKDSSKAVHDYSPYQLLGFDKWVSLINFRDNGLYFANPIYIRPRFFYYYLSPTIELKFDIDDLFYYSSHKIMKRKGHLFVADYGMQVNIVNRYGIKNYGVHGRDYRFINGDHYDFRYENIEIINRYHGVHKITKRGTTFYKTKIHLIGDYVVGTYKTEEEAAIAYNKAVDIAAKAGYDKDFPQNYLEEMSPRVYADIYSQITVSKKIMELSKGREI